MSKFSSVKDFSKSKQLIAPFNLNEAQLNSYEWFLKKGLKHAWLVQETANAFEHKVDTRDASTFDAARRQLMEYRKTIEGDFVSSPSIITYYESQSWGNPKANLSK